MKVAERAAGIAQSPNLTLNEDDRRIAEFSSVRFISKYPSQGTSFRSRFLKRNVRAIERSAMADELLRFRRLQRALAAAIRDPQNHAGQGLAPPHRLQIYRQLAYNNVDSFRDRSHELNSLEIGAGAYRLLDALQQAGSIEASLIRGKTASASDRDREILRRSHQELLRELAELSVIGAYAATEQEIALAPNTELEPRR